MKKSTLGIIFKTPLYLLIISSFIASIYAASKGTYNISYTSSILIAIIIILYIIGEILVYKTKNY